MITRWSSSAPVTPLTLLAVLAGSALVVALAIQPIRDEDLWWHVLIGREILETRQVSGLGNSWAPFGDQSWTTTQWLSEALYALALDLGGWNAVTLMRVFTAAVVAVTLGLVLMRHGDPRTSVVVYLVVLAGTALWLSRDRPQSLVLPLVVLAAVWLRDGLQGRYPRWWLVAMVSLIWSNLHGSWVMAAMVLGIVAVAAAVEKRWADMRTGAVLTATAAVGGMVNPAGVQNVTAVLRFRSSTEHILEWDTTPLVSSYGIMLLVLMLLVSAGWAACGPVPKAEIVAVLAVAIFGLLAIRNVPAALILLAPLASDRLAVISSPSPRPTSTEGRILIGLGATVAAVAATASVAGNARTDMLSEAGPLRLVEQLGELDPAPRVLNTYSLGGLIAQFGPDGVQVSIDGRADRYSPAYVHRYLDGERNLVRWEALVDATQPDVLLLSETSALATHVVELGWPVNARSAGFVLIERPQVQP